MQIPKLIHQIWLQGASRLPSRYRRAADTWQARNPGWNHRIWDEGSLTDFMRDAAPQWLPLFRAQREFCSRADIARYALLSVFGGLYADIDTVCVRAIEPLLSDEQATLLVHVSTFRGLPSRQSKLDPYRQVGNSMIGSIPGNPIWPMVLKVVASRNDPTAPVVWRTGPEMFWPIVKQFSQSSPGAVCLLPRRRVLTAWYLPRLYMRWYGLTRPFVYVLHYNDGGREGARALARKAWRRVSPFARRAVDE